MKKNKIPVEFCSYCGKKLIYKGLLGAENFGFPTLYPRDLYDKETGKRKMRYYISCPNRRTHWYSLFLEDSRHDAHAIGEEVLI